mmetsp:Transcript_12541/g.17149  ORF Transcript_12541/g.17149 Transcript_12541/m.17149 type:complete len:283 (-) Transcript_12541:83-931(-)
MASNNLINWYDTADSYGTGSLSGRSESLLGQFDSETAKKPKKPVYFCTKLAPFPWRIGKQSMIDTFSQSRKRLGRPIDMLQLHWPPSLGWQESNYLDAFTEIIASKEAKQLGMSNFGPKGLRRIDSELRKRGVTFHSNQVQFSLLSRQPLFNGFAETCAELQIQPIAYSPLALGLLTDKYTINNLPKGPRAILFREFLPVMSPLLNTLREIAKNRKKTVSQVALNWNLKKGFLVLVGIRSIDQAKENAGAAGWSLSDAEELALDAAADKVSKSLLQNPNQSD